MKNFNHYGSNAIQYTKNIIKSSLDNRSFTSIKLSAQFLKSFGDRSLEKPSLSAGVILMHLTRYVDVDYKIQISWQSLLTEMGMRSDIFYAAKNNLLRKGYVVKRIDGYYLTNKSHVVTTSESDILYVPNYELLSDYNRLNQVNHKAVCFLYFLIGNTVSPKTKGWRTYNIISLYENKYTSMEKFNLFKSIKELLNIIIQMESLGLIKATFINKNGESTFKVNNFLNKDQKIIKEELFRFLGYTFDQEKLVRNPRVQDYKVMIQVLLDDEKEVDNTANLEEFKNELSYYNLSLDNLILSGDTFSVEDNPINLFIDVKKQLINSVGASLGTKIYRDALRFYLHEKHDHLFGYALSGVGKAVNVFKKYYLLPYLKNIVLNTIERISLGDFLENELIKMNIAMYNVDISHHEFNSLVEYVGKNADISVLSDVLNMLENRGAQEQFNNQYPAFVIISDAYKIQLNKLYTKHIKNNRIDMDIVMFEHEILNEIIHILDKHSNETFENLIRRFVKLYQDSLQVEGLKSEIEQYQERIATMHKIYIKSHIEYALRGYSEEYKEHAPAVLDEVYNNLLENVPIQELLTYTEQQKSLLLERAKVMFEVKLKSKINEYTMTMPTFYNWLEDR